MNLHWIEYLMNLSSMNVHLLSWKYEHLKIGTEYRYIDDITFIEYTMLESV